MEAQQAEDHHHDGGKEIVDNKTKQKEKKASECKSTKGICGKQHLKAHSIEVNNIDTHKTEILDLETSIYTPKPMENNNTGKDRLHTITLIKDKFTISSAAYHELSLTSNLQNSNQIKTLSQSLNKKFHITCTAKSCCSRGSQIKIPHHQDAGHPQNSFKANRR